MSEPQGIDLELGTYLSRYVFFFKYAVHTTKAIQKSGEGIAQAHSESLEEWIRSTATLPIDGQSGPEIDAFITQVKKDLEPSWAMTPQHYEEVVLNTALVLEFSIFEMFLNHLVRAVLRKKPSTVQNAKPMMKLDGREIAKLSQGQPFLDFVVGRIVKQFDRDSFASKMDHLDKWFGLKEEAFYDWHQLPEPVQQNLSGKGNDYLRQLYGMRNDFVHKGIMAIRSGQGEILNKANEFFKYVSVNIAQIAAQKYGLSVNMFLASEQASKQFQAVQDHAPPQKQ